jgi:hypothetical protein
MDPVQLAPWLGGAMTALGAWAVAVREKAKRGALEAERMLENERQESRNQEHTIARLQSLEGRMDTQAQLIATLTAQNAEQASLIRELTSDKVRLAKRVSELERALAASEGREGALSRELAELRRDLRPSHKTMPPPGGKSR